MPSAVVQGWEGSIAVEWDRDDDNDCDEDSDDGHSSDTMDFPGGFPELMRHVEVTPPLAPKGTTGKLRRG